MKKFFSFVVVLAAVAMVSCGGNANTKPAEEPAVEAAAENTCCGECEKCDSTACCDKCEAAEATTEAAAE